MSLAGIEFGTVVWIVVLVSVPIAVIALAGAGRALSQIGRGRFSIERELPPPAAVSDAALREEVRQLVIARNERRMRRGERPLDVEAEVERQLHQLRDLT